MTESYRQPERNKNTEVTQDVFLDSAVLVLVFCTMPCARPSLKSTFKVFPLHSKKVKVLPTKPFHSLWFGVGGLSAE